MKIECEMRIFKPNSRDLCAVSVVVKEAYVSVFTHAIYLRSAISLKVTEIENAFEEGTVNRQFPRDMKDLRIFCGEAMDKTEAAGGSHTDLFLDMRPHSPHIFVYGEQGPEGYGSLLHVVCEAQLR